MKNYYIDYFVYNKKHHWFIIPAIVFYCDPNNMYDDLKSGLSIGFTFRWLTLMAGFQVQFENNKK